MEQDSKDKKTLTVEESTKCSYFTGPLPPPDEMQIYEQLYPGSSEKIIAMVEQEQALRLQLTKAALESELKMRKWGITFTFLIVFLSLIVSVFLILGNFELAGGFIGGVSILSLAIIFVFSVRSNNKKEGKNGEA